MRAVDVMFVLYFIVVQFTKATRQGTVLFMRAGTNMSLSELFHSSNHTDTVNLDKHLWSIDYLINGSNFRSPVLDHKDELNLTRYEVVAYNAAGEFMTSFQFENGVNGYVSAQGIAEFSEQYYSTSLLLLGAADTDKGRFVSTNVQSSNPVGSQFIFTTDEGFHDLPTDGTSNCYRFTAISLFTSLSDTFVIEGGDDCVRYCVTVPESVYAIAFTANKTNIISHRCACLQSINNAISIFGQYNTTLCPDDSECGCLIYSAGDAHVHASVYSMSNTNQFLDGLTHHSTTAYDFILSTNYPYILQSRRYVTEVRFSTSSNFTYTLGFADTPNCGLTETFSYYGHHLGSTKIFNASTSETIHPTPATCLHINILPNGTVGSQYVQIAYLTDTFTTAEYLQIVGYWTQVECEFSEVLHNSSIIPENWINVVQMRFPSNLMHGDNITFPEMSRNVMTINVSVNDSRFFVVRGISFTSDVDAFVVTTLNTNDTCVEIGYGTKSLQQYNNSFTLGVGKNTVETLTIPIICAYHITFEGRVQQKTGTVYPRVYHVQFTINGCVLTEPSLNAPCYNGDITSQLLLEANVNWIWVTDKPTAASYLRPGGPGVVLYRYGDPSIRIQLDDKQIPIEVTRVRITGDINQAHVTVGGMERFLDNTTGPMLDFRFTDDMRGHEIKIDQIFGRTDLDHNIFDFLVMKVAVGICSLSLDPKNSTSNTTVNTTQTIQNSSMPSTVSPGHTLSTPKLSTSSSTTMSGQNTTSTTNTSTTPGTNTSTTAMSGQNTTSTTNTSTTPGTNTSLSTSLTAPNTSMSSVSVNTTNTSITPAPTNNTTMLSTLQTTTNATNTSTTALDTTTSPTTSFSTTIGAATTHSTTTSTTTNFTTSTTTTTPALTVPTSTSSSLASTTSTPLLETSTANLTTPTVSSTSSSSQPINSTSSTTPTQSNTSTTSLLSNPPPPTQTSSCCVCFNDSLNITKEEIDTLVQQLVRNLTVPKRKTSAFKRTKESAPDERTSAKMVGTVGIVMMTVTAALIIAMDYTYIIQIIKFGRNIGRSICFR